MISKEHSRIKSGSVFILSVNERAALSYLPVSSYISYCQIEVLSNLPLFDIVIFITV